MRAASRRIDLRAWLSAWLVAVFLLASGAPCTGLAAPIVERSALSGPADPCQDRAGHVTPAPCCAQAACQVMAPPPPADEAGPAPRLSRADYDLTSAHLSGRLITPPTPPPRMPMN